MLKCVSCGDEINSKSFRDSETAGDCHPLCEKCVSMVEKQALNRQSLIRKLYSAGRGLSHCQACRAEGLQEFHFIKPLCQGGQPEAANILVLCSACHDRIHEPGARIRLKVKRQ